jgi:hypothetical protein
VWCVSWKIERHYKLVKGLLQKWCLRLYWTPLSKCDNEKKMWFPALFAAINSKKSALTFSLSLSLSHTFLFSLICIFLLMEKCTKKTCCDVWEGIRTAESAEAADMKNKLDWDHTNKIDNFRSFIYFSFHTPFTRMI